MRKSFAKMDEKSCMKNMCKSCGKEGEKLRKNAGDPVQNAVDFLCETGG
jgi:hypothetical protein